MTDVSLTALRVLREVAHRGSFSAAAEALDYTQSAVSRQIARLERAYGAALFQRTARGARPTDEGLALLAHADRVLDELQAAQRTLGGMRERSAGRVRVGAFASALAELVPRAVAELRLQRPAIDVALREGTSPHHMRRVLAGTLDIAIVGTLPDAPPQDPGLALRPLLDDPLLLAVASDHPFAARAAVDVADLAGERFIASSADIASTFLSAWTETHGWEPHVAITAREWTAKLGLVAAGLGVTLVPGLAASAVRADVALVRVRGPDAMRRVLTATRSDSELTPPAQAFSDQLRLTAEALARG